MSRAPTENEIMPGETLPRAEALPALGSVSPGMRASPDLDSSLINHGYLGEDRLREPLNNSLHAQSFRLVRNLGTILKVYVHPSRNCNDEYGPAWKTRRARPEAHICCALSLGKGATLTVETRLNSCTLQATLSMQGVVQRLPDHIERPTPDTLCHSRNPHGPGVRRPASGTHRGLPHEF